jgi:hypothetical protein
MTASGYLAPRDPPDNVWKLRPIWELLPELALSPLERLRLGPLAEAMAYTDHPIDLMQAIYDCIQEKLRADLKSRNPVLIARTLIAISWAYERLVNAGYGETFGPLLA